MRVLILGSGAKDHAIAWWFAKSDLITDLYITPGNVATSKFATNLPHINPADPIQVYRACVTFRIDHVFIGTEAPLLTGVVDYLNQRGIDTFGTPTRALKLESDRAFARAFTDRHNIPTPRRNLFANYEDLEKFLSRNEGMRYVIKSNTVAPSRVMLDSKDTAALLAFAKELLKKGPILLEEHIKGLSITCTLLVDNRGYMMLPLTSDYMFTSDKDGLPTGGMGAICPIKPGEAIVENIKSFVVEPTIYGMKVEDLSYKGVLTISIKVTNDDMPFVVDYHMRFNDPASQAFVPLVKNDAVKLINAMKEDRISEQVLEVSNESTVAVVIASEGYPMNPVTNRRIEPVNPLVLHNAFDTLPLVFTGAVLGEESDALKTSGGRNFTLVGRGINIKAANENVYRYIDKIRFPGSWYRNDIGTKFFANSEEISI